MRARDGGDAPIHQPLHGVHDALQVVVVVLVASDAEEEVLHELGPSLPFVWGQLAGPIRVQLVQISGYPFEDRGKLVFES